MGIPSAGDGLTRLDHETFQIERLDSKELGLLFGSQIAIEGSGFTAMVSLSHAE